MLAVGWRGAELNPRGEEYRTEYIIIVFTTSVVATEFENSEPLCFKLFLFSCAIGDKSSGNSLFFLITKEDCINASRVVINKDEEVEEATA